MTDAEPAIVPSSSSPDRPRNGLGVAALVIGVGQPGRHPVVRPLPLGLIGGLVGAILGIIALTRGRDEWRHQHRPGNRRPHL
jgi:hypothetical protein